MERSVHFRAIVVRHTNYDEADRFITFLTPYQGKVSALAKGVRKLNSRKAGHLQPFTYVDVQLSKGTGAAWLITQAATIEAYPEITESFDKTVRASCILELAERFSLENVENFQLFQLTLDTLRRFAVFRDIFPAQRYFDLQMLSVTGYRPQLFECVRCGKKIRPEDQFFHYGMGGVLCPDCGKEITVFGKSNIDQIAKGFNIPVLARIPMQEETSRAVDAGDIESLDIPELKDAAEKVESLLK